VGVYVGHVPNVVSVPILLTVVGGFVYAVLRRGSRTHERQESEGRATSDCCSNDIREEA
jgi:hypothetical protein